MGFLDFLKRNRAELSTAIGAGRYEDFSALNAARMRATRALIAEHARGRVLDVGCGHMPFRGDAERVADVYEGFDVERRTEGVTHVGNAEAMDEIPSASYDCVFSFEVLEHLPHPQRAMAEMARVLKPGGVLLLSVPHLSRLHEEPHDYFRYTVYGVRTLCVDAGLDVQFVAPTAGLFSFLAHQLSTLLIGVTWPVPGLRQLAYQLNRLLLVWPVLWLDGVMDRRGTFALGYVAVGRKSLR
ncbi:MAG TPA: class I SAM-dependent methyltransferase [Gemmatimonadaceae bacterium]|nr:class I SAM-dependent methyltransferase [Gemmatimonadaceae bacterium]HRQ78804.1 class I SAM-dependent methyltransferase [Gemmatimonadaceae bacterium]